MFNIRLKKKSYKMSFKAPPVKIQRSKNQQETANLVTFTEEFLNGKLHFL